MHAWHRVIVKAALYLRDSTLYRIGLTVVLTKYSTPAPYNNVTMYRLALQFSTISKRPRLCNICHLLKIHDPVRRGIVPFPDIVVP